MYVKASFAHIQSFNVIIVYILTKYTDTLPRTLPYMIEKILR